jgi:thymidine kinase
MVTDRLLQESDKEMLEQSLQHDAFHTTTTSKFFTEIGTLSKVYELDGEPILVARACKVLQLDLQFLDNNNVQANRKVMEEGFPLLAEKAKENGFKFILFTTSNPLLQRFCERKLKFETIGENVLRKAL